MTSKSVTMAEDLLAVTELLEATCHADADKEENAEDVLSWLIDNLNYVLRHLVSGIHYSEVTYHTHIIIRDSSFYKSIQCFRVSLNTHFFKR